MANGLFLLFYNGKTEFFFYWNSEYSNTSKEIISFLEGYEHKKGILGPFGFHVQ